MGLFDIFVRNKGGKIVISTEPEKEPTPERVEALESEETICNEIINRLKADRPEASYKFEIRHRSEAYTTLVYRNSDIARVKWSEGARWVKILMQGEMVDKYRDDPLFSSQVNKEEFMWIAYCTAGKKTLEQLYPLILETFDYIDEYKPEITLADTEKEYVKAAADLIADITGDSNNTYINRTTKDIRVMYKGSTALWIQLKPYKKKPWQIYCGNKKGWKEITDPAAIDKTIRKKLLADFEKFKENEETYTSNVELSYDVKWEG